MEKENNKKIFKGFKSIYLIFIIVIVIIFFVALYGIYLEKKNPTQQTQQEDINLIKNELNQSLINNETQDANPASVYCEENGGKLEIRENENGQIGICVFENAKECEEWAFYSKECNY